MAFKAEDRSKVARGTLHNLLGGIALASSKGFQFVLRRLFGGPAFGLYAITYGVMEMCANFLLGGFGDAVTYHASRYVNPHEGETPAEASGRERRLYAVLASSLRTPLLISLSISLTIYFGAEWIHKTVWSAHNIQLVSLLRTVIFALPLLTVVHLLAESTRAHLDMRLPVIVVQTMFPGLTIAIALLLHFALGYGIESMAFGLVYSLMICLPFAVWGFQRYYSLRKTWSAIIRFEGDPEVRKFAIPQCLNMASNLGLVKLDSLMLSVWVSADAVGIYVLLTELTQLVRLPKMAFSGIFGPLVAKYQHLGNKAGIAESLASLAQITSIIGIAAIIPIHLFYPEFILGTGKPWMFSMGLVWLLSVGPLMSTHFGLAGNLLLMTGHSRLLLLNSLGSLALNVLLNLLLIPRIGITGAAIATAVSNLTISSLQIYEMKRLEGYSFSIWLYHRVLIFMVVAAPILLFALHSTLPVRIGICAALLVTLGLCAWFIPGPHEHPIRSLWKKSNT